MVAQLPSHLAALLLAARDAEQPGGDISRRDAFRISRGLIGAAIEAGYAPRHIAACLDVTDGSIRTRAAADGTVPVDAFERLTDLDEATLQRLRRDGALVAFPNDDDTAEQYRAIDVVRAVAHVD